VTTTTGEARAVGVGRDPLLVGLSLASLRGYRCELGQEESRVSYWRRILQGRLDMLRAADAAPDVDNLGPMLASERVSRGRTALIEVVPADDIPPLPNLGELWERTVTTEPAEREELVAELVEAEVKLSSYRSALHARLSAATAELIARYREEPSRCLDVLPVQPIARRSVGS